MGKRYLFFTPVEYAYSILRPLQDEIWRRGDEVAWFLEEGCTNLLTNSEKQLLTISDVIQYNPIAVFSPVHYVYDFFPGVKVSVFHGYAINKRARKVDTHFTMKGLFDIYCTRGEASTPTFKKLEQKYGYFKVYETGWCKVDAFFKNNEPAAKNDKPLILYASTFSKKTTSAPILLPVITELIKTKNWDWILTLHPKLNDPEIVNGYKKLAQSYDNVKFLSTVEVDTYKRIDAMLCDTSSIIVEVMMFDKPVVTFKNANPGNHLINITDENQVGDAIELALTRPTELMNNIHAYTYMHEAHRDGRNSARVLDAVDDFIENYQYRIKKKPLNLIRKIKLRLRAKYYHW